MVLEMNVLNSIIYKRGMFQPKYHWVEIKLDDDDDDDDDDVKKIVQIWEKLPRSKRPNSKSYIHVKTSLDDPLVIAKLHFFSYVASIVEPFLKQFQSDKLMILFLSFELKIIITCLLEIIVQPEFIESCKCARQVKEISLTDKIKLLPVDKINNGFSVDVCCQQTSIQCNHIILDKGVQKRCPAVCNPNVVKIV